MWELEEQYEKRRRRDAERRSVSPRELYEKDLRYRGGHISGLDGLRAFAITGVTLYHLFPASVQGGYLGVVIFFVLSGFLMAVTADTGGNTGRELSSVLGFYKDRALRIYVPLIPVLLLTGAVLLFIAPETLTGKRAEVFSILFGYNNFWQISQNGSYFDKVMNSSPFTHMWYLAIIIQFYIIWPLLLKVINIAYKTRGIYGPLALTAGLSVIMALIMPFIYSPENDPTRVYYGTDTRIFSILFGVTAGLIWKSRTLYGFKLVKNLKKRLGRNKTAVLALLVFAGLTAVNLAGWFMLGGQDPFLYRGGMFMFTLIAVILIWIAAARTLRIGALLDNPAFKWIGSRSFEIYLWQYPVIYVFSCLGAGSGIWQAVTELLITCLLSELLHRFTAVAIKLIEGIHIDTSFAGETPKSRRRFTAAACTLCLCFAVGVYAYESSENVQSDRSELEDMLEKSANALTEQKASLSRDNAANAAASAGTAASEGVDDTDNSGDGAADSQNSSDENAVLRQGAEADGSDVTLIGDSVSLAASGALTELMPRIYIDAAKNRQFTQADEIVESLKASGALRETVVIALGSNGYFNEKTGQALIDLIGSDRQIYFVNTYGARLDLIEWMYDVNQVMENLSAANSNVHVIDWASLAPQDPDWMYSDGMHPKSDGCKAYAELIMESIVPE